MASDDPLDDGSSEPSLDGVSEDASEPAKRKRPSGYQQRKLAKQKRALEQAKHQQRKGVESLQAKLLNAAAEPLDALGNQRFANNAARIMAEAIFADPLLTLEQKARLGGEQLRWIAATHSKALQAERISKIQEKAGIAKGPKSDGSRVIPIDGNAALRAGSRVLRRQVVPRPMPDLPAEVLEEDAPDGGGSVADSSGGGTTLAGTSTT